MRHWFWGLVSVIVGISLALPYLRYMLNVMSPEIVRVGSEQCLATNGWGIDADFTNNGVKFIVLSRTNLSSPFGRKQRIQIVQDLPAGLMPKAPSNSGFITLEPFGQVTYAEIASFVGQQRVGQLSSTRYIGVYESGVIHFESVDHIKEKFCAVIKTAPV
jgi:hypothetical protein